MRGLAGILSLAALALLLPAAAQAEKTLKFVPQADLRVLDPLWTTAYITRNAAYMVYDTLFALDENFKPQPQMVESWQVSDDKLAWRFTLRQGLRFHDGQPVRPADVIASLERWMKKDSLGQKLAEATGAMTAVDDRTFGIDLKKPFALMLDALGKPSSYPAFIMPERLARTDANEQLKEVVGSGPFKFDAAEWRPGDRVAFLKNQDYVPRKELPSWLSGGKVVKVDRVEWIYIPDMSTAANALQTGEVDWWEQPPPDLIPVLQRNKDIRIFVDDPVGTLGMVRFNALVPPTDNQKLRQAILRAVDQSDYLRVLGGDPEYSHTCYSYYTCGTPMASEAGAEPLKNHSLDAAKQLVAASGYKGEKIVLMHATDQRVVTDIGLVTADLLRKLGLNVEVQAMDWGTLVTRRASKAPLDKGGWNIFDTGWNGLDQVSPAVNLGLRADGEKAWFGWPSDPKIVALTDRWFAASDLETQKTLAAAIQREAFASVPYIPTGQFVIPTAFRSSLDGVIVSPIILQWNVTKK